MMEHYPGGIFLSSSDVDSEGRTYLDEEGRYIKADGSIGRYSFRKPSVESVPSPR